MTATERTVWICQEPTKAGAPTFDFSPAAKYGTLKVVIPAGLTMLSPVPLVRAAKSKLEDFTSNDFLLAVGDPSVIAICAAIAARKAEGHFTLLKWDRLAREYLPIEIDLSGRAL